MLKRDNRRPRVLCAVGTKDVCELLDILLPSFHLLPAKTIRAAAAMLEQPGALRFAISDSGFVDGTALDFCAVIRAARPRLPIIVLASGSEFTTGDVLNAGGSRLVRYNQSSWLDDLRSAVDSVCGANGRPV
jgi:hypothetical protein